MGVGRPVVFLARLERRQRGGGCPRVVLLPGRADATPQAIYRCGHLDRVRLDNMDPQASVTCRLDHRALKQMSLRGVEQRVRRKDLHKTCRESSLGCHHTQSIGACNGPQGLSDGVARSLRHRVDDAFGPSAFGHGVVGLARQ